MRTRLLTPLLVAVLTPTVLLTQQAAPAAAAVERVFVGTGVSYDEAAEEADSRFWAYEDEHRTDCDLVDEDVEYDPSVRAYTVTLTASCGR